MLHTPNVKTLKTVIMK